MSGEVGMESVLRGEVMRWVEGLRLRSGWVRKWLEVVVLGRKMGGRLWGEWFGNGG